MRSENDDSDNDESVLTTCLAAQLDSNCHLAFSPLSYLRPILRDFDLLDFHSCVTRARSSIQMSTFSSQPIVIDGKGHLLGRLASTIAKQVGICCGKWEGRKNCAAEVGVVKLEDSAGV